VIPADLVVASHIIYYFADYACFLAAIWERFGPHAVAWLVVRDRDCPIYQRRFSLLAESGTHDTQASHFSDEALRAAEWEPANYVTSFRWRFPLAVPRGISAKRRVFEFLSHSRGVTKEALNGFGRSGWAQFSESHIFLSRPRESTAKARSADDVDAFRALRAVSAVFHAHRLGVADIQLARFTPFEQSGASMSQDPEAPEDVPGILRLWGWKESEAVATALAEYFERHPTFLLFSGFFSSHRRQLIESWRGSADARDEEFQEVSAQELDPKPRWKLSTLDVAWAEWYALLRRRYPASQTGRHRLVCMAVPARLRQAKRGEDEDLALLKTSAALFVTLIWPGSLGRPVDRGTSADTNAHLALDGAGDVYSEVQRILTAYVGTVAWRELRRQLDIVRYHRHAFGHYAARLQAAARGETEWLRIVSAVIGSLHEIKVLPERTETVVGALAWLGRHAKLAGAPVDTDCTGLGPDLTRRVARPGDMFLTLWNLWDNMPKGSSSGRAVTASGSWVRFSSTGAMPADWLAYLNGEQFEVPDATHWGLRTVREAVERNGWQVGARVELGQTIITVAF
jgi:hypothetical protein